MMCSTFDMVDAIEGGIEAFEVDCEEQTSTWPALRNRSRK